MTTKFDSDQYASLYSEGIVAEELTLKPVILNAVGEVKGSKIVDLGCGDGTYSKLFAERGASGVLGIDISDSQIENAKNSNNHSNIKYKVGSIQDVPEDYLDNTDILFMNMVVPDIGSKESLIKIFENATSVLNEEGRLVFTTLHPLALSPEQDDWDKVKDFNQKRYFDEGHIIHAEAITGDGNKIEFEDNHFSLTFLSYLLCNNNFAIRRLVESNTAPDKEMFLPKYILFECIQRN